MKPFLFLFLFLPMLSTSSARVIFKYDIENRKMQFDTQINWQVDGEIGKGSDDIVIIIEDSVGHPRCVIPSFGCTQYSMDMIDKGADIHLYIWPGFFYPTDCACDDQLRPNKYEADLFFDIYIRCDSICGKIHFNKIGEINAVGRHPEMHDVLHNPDKRKYLDDYYFTNLIEDYRHNEFPVENIVNFIRLFDNKINPQDYHKEVYAHYQYYRDVYLVFLPLLDKSLSLNDLAQLGEAIQRMISYQCW